jgi:hypothetical protein
MIATAAAFALTLLAQQPVDKSTLVLYQQRFVVRTPTALFRVPVVQADLPPAAVMYRRNDTFAVWDERGLTVRQKEWSFTTRFAELPVNPKVQSRAEIRRTVDLVKSGKRRLEAFAISGSRRFGSKAYYLVRWDSSDRTPWLETLVSVDLGQAHPKPRLEGLFAGLSLASQPIEDRLLVRSDKLAIAANGEEGWGLATFDPLRSGFEFEVLGHHLESFSPGDGNQALFVEKTEYDAFLACHLNKDGKKEVIFEHRGPMRFLDGASPPILVLSDNSKRLLYDAATGAEVEIARDATVSRTGPFILTWIGGSNPKSATLYRPDRWDVEAQWKRG